MIRASIDWGLKASLIQLQVLWLLNMFGPALKLFLFKLFGRYVERRQKEITFKLIQTWLVNSWWHRLNGWNNVKATSFTQAIYLFWLIIDKINFDDFFSGPLVWILRHFIPFSFSFLILVEEYRCTKWGSPPI